MKTRARITLAVLGALIALPFLASSCSLFLGHQKSKSAQAAKVQAGPAGSVVVYLGKPASKTVRPVFPTVTAYDLKLERAGSAPILLSGQTGASVTFPSVPVGTWSLTVDGFAGAVQVARAVATAVVTESAAAQVPVTLSYFQSTGTGDVDITLRFPDSVGITSVAVTYGTFGGTPSAPIDLTITDDSGALSSVRYLHPGLASGSYDVRFIFKADTTTYLTYIEAVQVWGNLASAADITLAATDFRTPPPAPATFAGADTETRAVQLTWDPSLVRTETKFYVQRSTSALFNDTPAEFEIAANAASYVDTSLTVGTPYWYRVASANDYGRSAWVTLGASVTATNVYPGDYNINSHEAYATFGNAGYWKVNGTLYINSLNESDLSMLSLLREVTGNLQIDSNGSLPNLNGLEGLTTVGGAILVRYNSGLTNVDGLSGVKTVGGAVGIHDDGSLLSVNLPALDSVGAHFQIRSCGSLAAVNVATLSVGTDFLLGAEWNGGNPYWSGGMGAVTALSFPRLQTVGGKLWVNGVNSTATVSFPALASAGAGAGADHIYFYDNAGIASISFPALTSVEAVVFQSNAQLVSASLPILTAMSGSFGVYSNALMTTLNVPLLATVGGYLDIGWAEDNGNYPNPQLDLRTALNKIQTVGGNLRIANNSAAAFNSLDLSALTGVGGELAIVNDDSLVSVALPNLVSANGIRFTDDLVLSSIQLPKLSGTVSGNFYVWDDPALLAITSGTTNTFAVTGEVLIGTYDGYSNWDSHWSEHHNALLADVSALGRITSVGGNFQVCFNNVLQQVTLTSLTSVGGDLRFQHNAALFGVTANAVTSVGANLIFEDSPLFSTMSVGTAGFTVGGDLAFSGCYRLGTLDGVHTASKVGGTFWIRYMGDNIAYALSRLFSAGTTMNAALGGLRVDECNYITTMDGLTIANGGGTTLGTVYIGGNDMLQNLSGVSFPNALTGDLRIISNNVLGSVSTLSTVGTIGGTLRIEGNPVLTALPLASLTQIGGNLELASTGLTGIAGLSNLAQVTGAVSITSNGVLLRIDGLTKLTTVGGNFDIISNASLLDIMGGTGKGLNALATVGGYFNLASNIQVSELTLPALTGTGTQFRIYDNDQLVTLSAPLLATVGTDLIVENDLLLADLGGLAAVQTVGAELLVKDNGAMTTLFGAASALSLVGPGGDLAVDYWGWIGVPESIYIQGCPKLENLSGLDGLSAVSGLVWLGDLPELSSIADLDNLTVIGKWLVVYNCGDGAQATGSPLTTLSFANLTTVSGELRIYENGNLTSLGMANLASIGGAARIVNNAALPQVDVDAWLLAHSHNGEEVSGNFNP